MLVSTRFKSKLFVIKDDKLSLSDDFNVSKAQLDECYHSRMCFH